MLRSSKAILELVLDVCRRGAICKCFTESVLYLEANKAV